MLPLLLHLVGVPTCEASPPDAGLSLLARTDVPLLVGVGAEWEHASRLRVGLAAGAMPGPYLDLTNSLLVGWDVYSEDTASLIDAALRGAYVARLDLGYRPLARRGLVVSVGYQHMFVKGDTADLGLMAGELIGAAAVAAQDATGDLEVSVAPRMLTGEVGWQWVLRDRLVLGAQGGMAYTVAARTRVAPTQDAAVPGGDAAMDLIVAGSEDYLTYVFEKWVHIPWVGVRVGYRFP